MPVSNPPAFDALAADYDSSFSQGLTGSIQRMRVRGWLMKHIRDKEKLTILEINCGTGDDALWLHGMGHHVLATDASGAMISEAREKAARAGTPSSLQFEQCAFDNLGAVAGDKKFDLVFSNFSGLNCADSNALQQLGLQLHALLQPGGYLSVVIFGKYNWWEMLYYTLKGKPGTAFRRLQKKPSAALLKPGVVQPVYYYSVKQFCSLLPGFVPIEKRPVGLLVPPSYLEGFMQKHRQLFNWLEKKENQLGDKPAFSQLADHLYLLLKKV